MSCSPGDDEVATRVGQWAVKAALGRLVEAGSSGHALGEVRQSLVRVSHVFYPVLVEQSDLLVERVGQPAQGNKQTLVSFVGECFRH